jgi:hypothetical protein
VIAFAVGVDVTAAFKAAGAEKHRVLPEGWAGKRLKALRFAFIQLAGRVLDHARQLIIRLSSRHPLTGVLLAARQRIVVLAQAPPG